MKSKRTALIVDDDDIVLEVEEFMFQKIGFDVLIAKNCQSASKFDPQSAFKNDPPMG